MNPDDTRSVSAPGAIMRLSRNIWALGFVSMFMDISSELVHSLLPVFMVTVLGTSMLTIGLSEVEASLEKLGRHKPDALAVQLPRMPGRKEARFMHLLAGDINLEELEAQAASAAPLRAADAMQAVRAENERLARLESDVAALRQELADVRAEFAEFRRQFE